MSIHDAFNDIAVAQGGTACTDGTIIGAIDALNDALAGSDQDRAKSIEEAIRLLGSNIGGGAKYDAMIQLNKYDIGLATEAELLSGGYSTIAPKLQAGEPVSVSIISDPENGSPDSFGIMNVFLNDYDEDPNAWEIVIWIMQGYIADGPMVAMISLDQEGNVSLSNKKHLAYAI